MVPYSWQARRFPSGSWRQGCFNLPRLYSIISVISCVHMKHCYCCCCCCCGGGGCCCCCCCRRWLIHNRIIIHRFHDIPMHHHCCFNPEVCCLHLGQTHRIRCGKNNEQQPYTTMHRSFFKGFPWIVHIYVMAIYQLKHVVNVIINSINGDIYAYNC